MDLRKLCCPLHPLSMLLLLSLSAGQQPLDSRDYTSEMSWPVDLPFCLQQFTKASWVLVPWHSDIHLLTAVTTRSPSVTSSCCNHLSVVWSSLYIWQILQLRGLFEHWSYPPHAPVNSLCAHLTVFIFKMTRFVLFYTIFVCHNCQGCRNIQRLRE